MPLITQLKESEVFVFGANEKGFHGAGSAGFAFHAQKGNVWRTNDQFQKALQTLQAKERGQNYDPENLKGNWAILGEIGLMQGKIGQSYGIVTTEAPGKQGKVNADFLLQEMKNLMACANTHPKLTFLCVNFGLSRAHGGFAWWSPHQLRPLWNQAAEASGGCPKNIQPPEWTQKKTLHRESKPTNSPGLWDTPKSPEPEM